MKRSSTPSFVLELPLVVQPREERKLLASFEAGRRLYNACLGEALERLDRMRSSEDWHRAQALPKWVDKKTQSRASCSFQGGEPRVSVHLGSHLRIWNAVQKPGWLAGPSGGA